VRGVCGQVGTCSACVGCRYLGKGFSGGGRKEGRKGGGELMRWGVKNGEGEMAVHICSVSFVVNDSVSLIFRRTSGLYIPLCLEFTPCPL
jgi:hypothetical protein